MRATLPHVSKLVGVAEIAEMLGLTRQRVQQLAKLADFPTPEAILKAGHIWNRTAVEQWAKATGRL